MMTGTLTTERVIVVQGLGLLKVMQIVSKSRSGFFAIVVGNIVHNVARL